MHMLAGGGPSTPDARVLLALTTPLIGQFDPAFTAIMDDVVQLAREVFLTSSPHCFAISALPSGGLEAVINSLTAPGDLVAIGGGPTFVAHTAEIVRRCGALPATLDTLTGAALLVVPHIDPDSGVAIDAAALAREARSRGVTLALEATQTLGARELRVDDWGLDVCIAGADHAVGAPSGTSLVTYTADVQTRLQAIPRNSYLDLRQLQAYWSPERLNHHTAPTSLIYGLREALRLAHAEGLEARWQRHAQIGQALREGLTRLGLEPTGDLPYSLVHVPDNVEEQQARRRLHEDFGVHVTLLQSHRWWLGLLGADARMDIVRHVLAALDQVLGSRQ